MHSVAFLHFVFSQGVFLQEEEKWALFCSKKPCFLASHIQSDRRMGSEMDGGG